MASTRNINTKNNYCIQQRQFQNNYVYNSNLHSQWVKHTQPIYQHMV